MQAEEKEEAEQRQLLNLLLMVIGTANLVAFIVLFIFAKPLFAYSTGDLDTERTLIERLILFAGIVLIENLFYFSAPARFLERISKNTLLIFILSLCLALLPAIQLVASSPDSNSILIADYLLWLIAGLAMGLTVLFSVVFGLVSIKPTRVRG